MILALTAQTSDKMLTGGFLSGDDYCPVPVRGIGHIQVIHCRPRVNQGQNRQILEEQVGDWLVKGHLVYCSCRLLLLKEQVGDWVVKGHLV